MGRASGGLNSTNIYVNKSFKINFGRHYAFFLHCFLYIDILVVQSLYRICPLFIAQRVRNVQEIVLPSGSTEAKIE